jgi:hypothetical protein
MVHQTNVGISLLGAAVSSDVSVVVGDSFVVDGAFEPEQAAKALTIRVSIHTVERSFQDFFISFPPY